jgi:hypothetical protein
MVGMGDDTELSDPEWLTEGSSGDYRQIVHTMLLAVAKARSNMAEAGTLDLGLSRWLDDGPVCILPLLERLDEREEPPSRVEILNLLIVAHRLEPSIAICALRYGGLPTPDDLTSAVE